MTGPSPWRLPSPRGGVTSVTVSGSTIEPVGSIILLPVPGTTLLRGRETSRKAVARTRRGIDMNVTLITAIALLLAWGTLVFGAHLGSGPVHLLYAVSVILFARRIIVGAPTFRRSEEHTSELQSPCNLVCRLLLEKKKKIHTVPVVLSI